MAKNEILLDPEHGLNPMLDRCFYCNEPKGVALLGQITPGMRKALSEATGTAVRKEAPRQGVVLDMAPCHQCAEYMEQGVILISVDEERSKGDEHNPYRTGGWCVVSEDFIRRVLDAEAAETILKARRAFVPDQAWDVLGLPRE